MKDIFLAEILENVIKAFVMESEELQVLICDNTMFSRMRLVSLEEISIT